MRNQQQGYLDRWKLLELEPIERQEQIINRLAPAQPRTLAQRFSDETFNEILQKSIQRQRLHICRCDSDGEPQHGKVGESDNTGREGRTELAAAEI